MKTKTNVRIALRSIDRSGCLSFAAGRRRLAGGMWLLGALGLSLAALVFSAAPARATQAHGYERSFAGAGEGAGQLALVAANEDGAAAGSSLAVNSETHNVYVADTGNSRVDEFDPSKPPSEQFVRAWGWGVATGAAELQSCTAICQKGLSGSNPGELGAPTFIAIDNSAGPSKDDVYVGDQSDDIITKYDKEGHLVTGWGNNGPGKTPNGQLRGSFAEEPQQLGGIAVDAAGNLWARGIEPMFEFAESGVPQIQEWTTHLGSHPAQIGLDSFTDLYALGQPHGPIVKFTSAGEELGAVFVVSPARITGLVVDPVHGNALYVDEGSAIQLVPALCERVAKLCLATQTFGSPQLTGAAGLAVDPAGVIYAANTAADQVAVFRPTVEATIAAASEVKATTAILNGEVNPEGAPLTKCRFEYGTTTSYGGGVPCEESLESIGSGTSLVKVHAKAHGLSGGAGYHFRLHAGTATGDVRSDDETFATLPIAVIEEAMTSEVTATSAVLTAKVNPEGVVETKCRLEYGTSTSYGTTVPCEPSEELGSGTTGVPVSRHLEGLTAETTYHWRVVISDANAEAIPGPDVTFTYITATPVEQSCPNEALRVDRSSLLADCRAYEMVTPPAKNGALVGNVFLGVQDVLSEEGTRVISSSTQCFAAAPSCVADRQTVGAPFEFARSAGGWVARAMGPPASAFTGNSLWSFSVETGAVLYSLPNQSGPEEFYAARPDGSLQAIGPFAEHGNFRNRLGEVILATSDLSHVAYNSLALWEFDETTPGKTSLYDYAGTGNTKPALVGVSGGAGSTDLISVCDTFLGSPHVSGASNWYGPLSADGAIVYFTAEGCATGSGANKGTAVPANELYARIEQSHTELISGPAAEPECDEACQGQAAGDALFEGASADGSRVFFTSTQQLNNSASEDSRSGDSATADEGCAAIPVGASGCNLYESECPGHCGNASDRHLVDVSAGDSSGLGPQVRGVVAISSDGSHVYFVARGVLTAAANAAGQEPVEGANNLYAYERDAANPEGRLAFIATLPDSDASNWRVGIGGSEVAGGPGAIGGANVTPDGRFLVFASHAALTPDTTRPEGPAQVYRYDDQAGVLVRVSIGEHGFNDNGNAAAGDASIARAGKGFREQAAPGRADPTMSHDGSYVFFQSPAALTPGALNNVEVDRDDDWQGLEVQELAQNIYEWEADGIRACTEPGGCVSLISDGRDISEGIGGGRTLSSVELLGSDASGSNVLFTTADSLLAQDTDSQLDFYDARIEGGFPAPVTAHVCQGEECREPGSAAFVFGPLASTTLSGAGNLTPQEVKPPGKPPPSLTRKQKLAKALKACKKDKSRKKRVGCEKQARKRYGSQKTKAKVKQATHDNRRTGR